MEGYAASCRTKVLVLVPENEAPTRDLDRVHRCSTYSFLAMPWSAGGQVNVVLRGSRLVQRLSFDCGAAVDRGMVWMAYRDGIQGRMERMSGRGEGAVCGHLGVMTGRMEAMGCGTGANDASEGVSVDVGENVGVGASVSESEGVPGSLLREARRWDQPFPSRVGA